MSLTAVQIRNAKPAEKPYKMADGNGLFLYVTPTGARSWRLKYRFGGREKLMTFGLYPDVGLADARSKRQDALDALKAGVDPAAQRVAAKAIARKATDDTFEAVARAWHDAERPRWSPGQAKLILRALERDAFPTLGPIDVADVTGMDLITMLRKIEARGSIETAKRVRGYCLGAFGRAKAEGKVAFNPASDIGDALRPTIKGAKQPAITDAAELIALQQTIDRSTCGPAVKLASRLLALTVVRIGVLRAAPWSEFTGIDWNDPDAPAPSAMWRVPAARMKLEVADKGDTAYDHDVPLPPQAVAVLRALRPLTGKGALLFPSQRSVAVPMSDAALSTAYKRRGFKGRHVPHGWRAAFSTVMNERAVELEREGDRLIVDLMLAHAPRGMSASEFAYNRARYSARRRELATAWADLITEGLAPPYDLVGDQAR